MCSHNLEFQIKLEVGIQKLDIQKKWQNTQFLQFDQLKDVWGLRFSLKISLHQKFIIRAREHHNPLRRNTISQFLINLI